MSEQKAEIVGGIHDGLRLDADTSRDVLAYVVVTRASDGGLDATLSVKRGVDVDREDLAVSLTMLALDITKDEP